MALCPYSIVVLIMLCKYKLRVITIFNILTQNQIANMCPHKVQPINQMLKLFILDFKIVAYFHSYTENAFENARSRTVKFYSSFICSEVHARFVTSDIFL